MSTLTFIGGYLVVGAFTGTAIIMGGLKSGLGAVPAWRSSLGVMLASLFWLPVVITLGIALIAGVGSIKVTHDE